MYYVDEIEPLIEWAASNANDVMIQVNVHKRQAVSLLGFADDSGDLRRVQLIEPVDAGLLIMSLHAKLRTRWLALNPDSKVEKIFTVRRVKRGGSERNIDLVM